MKNYFRNDMWVYRVVVAMPGLTVMASMTDAIALAMTRQPTSGVIVALGPAAIGSLAGLSAASPLNR